MIEKFGISGVTSTLVLSDSGISKSSLYHFFEDFGDLLIEAQIEQYREIDNSWCKDFRELASTSSSVAEFHSGLVTAMQSYVKNQKRDIRFQRVAIISSSKNSRLLQEVVAQLQEELTVGLTQAFELAQAKGFLVSNYRPRSIAVALQALLYGKIFDDVLLVSMQDKDWASLSLQVFEEVFLNNE
jgi:AcrR family transcriptional regulator